MIVEIEGAAIRTERDFHEQLARKLDLGPYYGRNLDALWDSLSADVERPVRLVWRDAAASRAALGERFEAVVAVLSRVAQQDVAYGWTERFELELA
jgi:ribonuclease inhibitor